MSCEKSATGFQGGGEVRIEARVYATLRRYLPEDKKGNPIKLELPEGTMVGEVVEKILKIPPDAVKVVFVNGRHVSFEYILADGDRVGIFPPVAGG